MELSFREYGAGRPLIILHGLFGQSDNWNTLAKNFAEQQLHVFALDQRNHGLSPHDPVMDYTAMSTDLMRFITDHGLKQPVIMGHSMGAKTLLYFEKFYPGITSGLIIVDMAARAYEPHHQQVLKALKAVDFDAVNSRKQVEAILNEHLDDYGTKQFLLKNVYWKDEAATKLGWRFNLEAIDMNYDKIRAGVPSFISQTPTLIIAGGKSNYINDADRADFKKMFPQSQFITVEGAGHWVHAEKPRELFEAVHAFIKGVAP